MTFKTGDFFWIKDIADGVEEYVIYRCLRIDPEHGGTAHVSMYASPHSSEPIESDLDDLELLVMHMPIALDGFSGYKVFGNRPIKEEDLQGYLYYLKSTDFNKYLEITGQNADDLIKTASQHFNSGNELCDLQKFQEAILEYGAALEILPFYFEAADNMGFAYMDLGEFENAIPCFENSLYLNPEGFAAMFSIGECFYKLGDDAQAKYYFDQARSLPNLTSEMIRAIESYTGKA